MGFLESLNDYPALLLAFIVLARVADVSIGTVRTICVFRGYRVLAAVLGFAEVIVWVLAVSGVLSDLTVMKVLAYGVGFALGNALGMWIENQVALGRQMLILISRRRQHSVAFALRLSDFVVTEVPARGRGGQVAMCMMVAPRRKVPEITRVAREVDPNVFISVQDVREPVAPGGMSLAGVSAPPWIKKK